MKKEELKALLDSVQMDEVVAKLKELYPNYFKDNCPSNLASGFIRGTNDMRSVEYHMTHSTVHGVTYAMVHVLYDKMGG